MINHSLKLLRQSVAIPLRVAAATVIVTSLTGCFTGIESTPKITDRDVKRQSLTGQAANSILHDISGQAPSGWKQGKQFFVTDERVRRALRFGTTTPDTIAGAVLTVSSIDTVPSLTGERLIELTFAGPSNLTARYSTGIATGQWERLETYELPFMIELDVIDKVRKRLVNNQYYYLAARRFDGDGRETEGRRYNQVTVIDVSTGDTTRPIRVTFRDADSKIYSTLMTLGNEPTSLRNFETLFSVENPRKKYPRIADDVWELIQNSRVRLGMTPEECRLALGSPDSYRRIPTTAGMVEQWSFNNGSFLTFEDGQLSRFRL